VSRRIRPRQIVSRPPGSVEWAESMLTYHFSRKRSLRTREVQFGLLSCDCIRKMAVCEVTNPNIYHRGTPQSGAINDLLMGTIDRRLRCATCNGDVRSCQGHPGCMELGVPVYSIGFLDTTLKVLRSVCYCCSALLLAEEDARALGDDLEGKLLFHAIYAAARMKKRCHRCDAPQPTFQRVGSVIKMDWPADALDAMTEEERGCVTNRPFSSVEAGSILNHITDEDARLMGFDTAYTHPRDLTPSCLLVPPPIARPAICQSTGSRIRGQDDITHTLQSILKKAIDVKSYIAAHDWCVDMPVPPELLERVLKMQYEVYALVNNGVRGNRVAIQRSGAPVKSLVCRLKGKEGRIRGNLSGKRVDFSARSVVSPDPNMSIDEVGIPEAIAKELTIQERVTNTNIADMRRRVLVGANDLGGASAVIGTDGKVTQLEFCKNRCDIPLTPGCVIERYLRDGDAVVFNRQPSLHKFSMMAHRAKIMPGNTFRLNLSCTQAYNADFDGDEMNLHALQSVVAQSEAKHLLSVPANVISPQANKPVIAIVQDTLLGAAILTQVETLLSKEHYMRFATWIRFPASRESKAMPPPALVCPGQPPLWTGAQLFSALLPPALTMTKGKRSPEWPSEADFYVREGRLMYGRANKGVLGAAAGGLVDVICRDVGAHAIVHFQTDIQRVVNQFLITRGFSVKISDCILTREGDEEVRKLVKVASENARSIVESDLPDTLRAAGEATVCNCLSRLLMQTGSVARKHLRSDNAISTMIFEAQSKGNAINQAQISGTVAQTTVEGKRIFFGTRTLTCYAPGEKTLRSNGFVKNNYLHGLLPEEFFFHAMGGREGLVDTAVKTASTGYIQRRQVKLLEDHKVSYDGTVRSAQDAVLEFVYGGDGFDGSRVERFAFHALLQPDAEVLRASRLAADGKEARDLLRNLWVARDCRVSVMLPHMDVMVLMPFHPDRLLAKFALGMRPQTGVPDPAYQDLVCTHQDAFEGAVTQDAPRHCLVAVVRTCFSSSALFSSGVQAEDLATFFSILRTSVDESRIQPGEMVGTLAATSTGEVTTQMTLNSFHYSGVGAKGVSQGLPRLKELLDITKKTKTPSNCLVLKRPFHKSPDFAARFARTLGRTKLGTLVTRVDLLHEPDFGETSLELDKMMVEMESFLTAPQEGSSEWVARLALSKQEMQARELTPPDLQAILVGRLGDLAHIVSSQVNAVEWAVRVRLRNVRTMLNHGFPDESVHGLEETLCQRIIASLLDGVQVAGHVAVTNAREREVETWEPSEQKNETHHVVDTLGVALNELGLLPVVDWERSTTNDLMETMETMGIEAAMHVLFHEIRSVMTDNGTYLDTRHVNEIACAMTAQGFLKAISRHGMNKPGSGTGPLVRCSFEETADVLVDAGIWSEKDDSRGVTSSVINGDQARIGTGVFDVLYPDWALPHEAHVSARQAKLVKSKVRSVAAPQEDTGGSSVELVDTNLWSFDGSSGDGAAEVDLPFVDGGSDGGAVENSHTKSGSACYARPPQPRRADGLFVPSSPRMC